MFDDRDGGAFVRIEFGDEIEGRVGVGDIIVGEFLALHLPGRGEAGRSAVTLR